MKLAALISALGLLIFSEGQSAKPAAQPAQCSGCVTSAATLNAGSFAMGNGGLTVKASTPAAAALLLAPFLPQGQPIDTSALNVD